MADPLQPPPGRPQEIAYILDDGDILRRTESTTVLELIRDIRKGLADRVDKPTNCSVLHVEQNVEYDVSLRELVCFDWETATPSSCVKRPLSVYLRSGAAVVWCNATAASLGGLEKVVKQGTLALGSSLKRLEASARRDAARAAIDGVKSPTPAELLAEKIEAALGDSNVLGSCGRVGVNIDCTVLRPPEIRQPVSNLMRLGFVDEETIRMGVVEHNGEVYIPVTHAICPYLKIMAPRVFMDFRVLATGPSRDHTFLISRKAFEAILDDVLKELSRMSRTLSRIPGYKEGGKLTDLSQESFFLAYCRPNEEGFNKEQLLAETPQEELDRRRKVVIRLSAHIAVRTENRTQWAEQKDSELVMPGSVVISDLALQQNNLQDPGAVKCPKIPSLHYASYMLENDKVRVARKKALYSEEGK